MLTDFLLSGFILGITIGLTPGPLLFLAINDTLDKGIYRGGLQVLIGMLLVDVVIIIPLTLIASFFFQDVFVQRILSVFGGLFLIYIGVLTIKVIIVNQEDPKQTTEKKGNPNSVETTLSDQTPGKNTLSVVQDCQSFFKGITIQILNPLAYIFWITVGTSQMLLIMNDYDLLSSFLFPISFWIGLEIVLFLWVVLAAKAQDFLSSRWYFRIQIVCGFLLIVFGVLLLL